LSGVDPYRFNDRGSFVDLVKNQAPEIDATTEIYLRESARAFFADCLLSASVMLGVAAESLFLRLADAAEAHAVYGSHFKGVSKERAILGKITRFRAGVPAIAGALPSHVREDIDTNLNSIQAVIRTSRNDSGHPTGRAADRAQTYVSMQLFAPYARKVEQLREFFETP
jgi:hypothetical protein